MATDGNKPAAKKRDIISKAQQMTILEVLGASLVLGTCIVLSTFLIKYIKFNTTVIAEKNEAISDYDATIRYVGICVDKDGNGRLSDKELQSCNPSDVKLDEVKGSLRYNVLETMAQNEYLESVARQRNEKCYDEGGKRIDFNKLYEETNDETEKKQYLQSAKICSALRVIPDALPAQQNTEALMASLNQIFILAGVEPERLAPQDTVVDSTIEGVSAIPVSLQLAGSDFGVMVALDALERSIREFDVTTAAIEWTARGLSLNATANAYFLSEKPMVEQTKMIYASKKARSTSSGSSSGKLDSAQQNAQELTGGNN